MARLDILAPQLFRALLDAAPGAPRDALADVLARGDLVGGDDFDFDARLLAWFGLAGTDGVAALTAALDLPDAAPGHWLRVDPVHLRADPTRLILFDVDAVGLDANEADELIAHLNGNLGADGLRLLRGRAPGRWYLRLDAPVPLALAAPRSLRGRAVEDSLGDLRRAGALNRLLTEVQMLLYEAPVNLRRGAAGRAPINSLWPWGGGEAPRLAAGARRAVLGEDALLAACARGAGIAHHAGAGQLAEALAGGAEELLLGAHGEPGELDLAVFAAGVLAPARAALARGALACVSLHGHHASVTLTRSHRWRAWRRGASFLRDLRTLAAPPAAGA